MERHRIIPSLLLKNKGLVKGIKFSNHKYVGDPINAVRIFSTMEVDELFFLNIAANSSNSPIPFDYIQEIADECYMPFAYGGGVKSIKDIEMIIKSGAEKVVINTQAFADNNFIREASNIFGSQAIVVSIDVLVENKSFSIFSHSGQKRLDLDLEDYVKQVESLGAGEILITAIHRDGTMNGFDINLSKKIADLVQIPVIACGGCWTEEHIIDLLSKTKIHAVAAASMFVFHGSRDGVLINYLSNKKINKIHEEIYG